MQVAESGSARMTRHIAKEAAPFYTVGRPPFTNTKHNTTVFNMNYIASRDTGSLDFCLFKSCILK